MHSHHLYGGPDGGGDGEGLSHVPGPGMFGLRNTLSM